MKVRIATLIVSVVMVCACTDGGDSQRNANEAVNENLAKSREELKQQLHDAIDQADEHIAKLESQAANASEDVRQQLSAAIAGIQKERKKVVNQVKEVTKASESSWKEIRKESDAAMRIASEAYDSLSSNFGELVE